MTGGPAAARPSAFVFVADLDEPVLDPSDRHHLARVLRLRRGEAVVVADGSGGWRPCEVRLAPGADIVLEPLGEVVHEPAPAPALTVGFALTKGGRPELAVQKLTELGVDVIVPVAARRSVARWEGERSARNLARLEAVAREAAMQARRPRLPEVRPVAPLAAAVGGIGPFALCEAGGTTPLSLDRPALFVGPEGGWSEEEVGLAPAVVDLGPTTLRAETATIAAGTLLCALRSATVRANEVSRPLSGTESPEQEAAEPTGR